MKDEILDFLEKEFRNWRNIVEKDCHDRQHYYGEEGQKLVKTKNNLYKELIENRKKEILEKTRKEVLKKLTKEEMEILGIKLWLKTQQHST